MKTYPYQDGDRLIQLVEKRELDQLVERLDKAEELLREIRDDEVNPQDEADKFLRDHQPSELAKMRADNAELIVRLAEARESHLHASARDVQTIQRQAILLERLAGALEKMLYIIGVPSAGPETLWRTDDEVNEAYHTSLEALAAYESANFEPVANPVDEAVRRMEEVPVLELNKLHFDAMDYANFNDIEAVRARLISAAKGEQL
jgi:hypothetical protein